MATKTTLMIKHARSYDDNLGYLNNIYKQRAMKRLERYLRRFPFDMKAEELVGHVPNHIVRNASLARG